jgi:hypothetical protein
VIYEIVNPSDPYTLVSDDLMLAAAATLMLGEGRYGLKAQDETSVMPVLFDRALQWLRGHGIPDFSAFIAANALAIASVLDSVLIGPSSDRRAIERVLALITDSVERAAARAAYHDERRSSMNDIGAYAGRLANTLRTHHQKLSTSAMP